MTNTTLDKPELGDLVMDYGGDVGVISFIETDKVQVHSLLCPLVKWLSNRLHHSP